ncbi:MAG TPA: ubiquinol-cytochrome c reductase iron-sulfur subunit [Chloroflexia bacterium]|jgi:cytochrome b6-f complex iron-sulfur subunit|nr:ubiquinol-cytochrome c reductase iron-sulfur subunit [Chloroflexia bacterium]
MSQQVRTERTLTPRVHTRPGPEDTQGGLVQGASRRDFLRLTMLGSLGVMSLGGIGAFLAYFWPRKIGTFGSKISAGTLDDIKDGDVLMFREGKFYLSRYQEPALGNKDVILALYWKCKHLGCTVPWKPDESFGANQGIFHCPCHGSIYLRTGQNVAGPAPAPLDIMEITLDGRKITVNTGKITTRVQYEPKQATPVS